MRARALLMLGLAAALGLVAVYLARGWIQNQTRVAVVQQPQMSLTTVVVAKRPLSLGDEITREFIQEVPWPVNAVPDDSFRKVDELVRAGSDARVALRSIQVNEPILKQKVTGFGGRATLSTLIQKDMRGVTIRVNDVLGVAGFIMPADHVDVLLTRQSDKDHRITDVLIQNVKVLGIDQEASDDKDKPKVVRAVTLEVTPDQGQKLALASLVGTLSLSLRQSLNTNPVAHRTIRERDLVDDNLIRSNEPPKAEKPAKFVKKYNPYTSVKVVRGLKATTQEVVIEKPGSNSRPASGAPRSLTPTAPKTASTAPTVSKPAAKPEAKRAAPAPAKAPENVIAPVPREKGAPIPLWRDKPDTTVQGDGSKARKVSFVVPRAGG